MLGEKYFLGIPPGAAKPCFDIPSHLQKGPKMRYKQKPTKQTCMVYSFASALDYIGARQAGSELYRKSNMFVNKSDAIQKFSVAARQIDEHLRFKKIDVRNYDILKNGENDLVLASLKGSDGKDDHCVTVYGSWLFDSNFDYALPLTKEALDLCCSAENTQDKFVSVNEARICQYAMDIKKKKSKKKNKKRKWS